MTRAEKLALIRLASERGIRIDGRPAVIGGASLQFAKVGPLDGGWSVEYAWSAVKNVIENGREFASR